MLIEHAGRRPNIDRSATVASTAVVCGDVTIGPECRILFGAVITAEGGPVAIGRRCIVMENAVIRASRRHPVTIGDHVLIGPRAYLSGCAVESDVFLATGATVFNGARIESRAQVRVNGVVHLKTRLPAGAVVPIGWVAVGDPASILAPGAHDEIWAIQRRLDFPREIFGLERPPGDASLGSLMPELTRRYGRALAAHADDRIVDGDED